MRDQVTQRRAKFVPSQFAFQATRTDGGLMDQFDEWLSRIEVAYARTRGSSSSRVV